MKRRYAVAISAMILAMPMGEPASAADPSVEQLEIIQEMLEENDVEDLRRYIADHPELLEGYTALTRLLVRFMDESSNIFRFLGFGTTAEDDGPGATPDLLSVRSIY